MWVLRTARLKGRGWNYFQETRGQRTETRAFLAGLSIVAAQTTLPHFTYAFIQTARFLPSALFSLTASTLAVNLTEQELAR